jgi:hypothetical protein
MVAERFDDEALQQLRVLGSRAEKPGPERLAWISGHGRESGRHP